MIQYFQHFSVVYYYTLESIDYDPSTIATRRVVQLLRRVVQSLHRVYSMSYVGHVACVFLLLNFGAHIILS